MNEFEKRWPVGVQAARRAAPALTEEAPLGFATRVVALWQTLPEPSLTMLWQRFALRALGAMTIIFLSLAAYDVLTPGNDTPLPPPLENVVGDTLSLL